MNATPIRNGYKGEYKELPIGNFPPFPIGTRRYEKGEVRVIYSPIENLPDGLWSHLSLSCVDRYPTWEEILDCRYTFFKDTDEVFQVLPPKGEYINLHPNCFHLWHAIGRRVTPA